MRVLQVIHDFLPRHRAGSEIYAFHLARTLTQRHDVTVLCAEYDPTRPHGSLTSRTYDGLPVVELVNNWAFPSFEDTYTSDALNRSLDIALEQTKPDVLHIHNLLNLSMDLPAIARRRGVPSVATLHDYTLLCPSGGQRVHVAEKHVCHTIDAERCSRCFPQSPFAMQMGLSHAANLAGKSTAVVRVADIVRRRLPILFQSIERRVRSTPTITPADIRERLGYVRRVFDAVDLFVAPSRALAREYQAAGLPAARIRVSDYGFVPFSVPTRPLAAKLRFGFVGTLVWHKGVHILLEAVRTLPQDRFEVKLYGDTNVFPAYVAILRDQARGLPVTFMGGFDEAQIGEVYRGIDVLVVPSLWLENSPLVIHEAFMAGIPVVGAQQGGIPELVTNGVNGLIFEPASSDSLRAALQRILDNPRILSQFARNLPQAKSIETDAAEWEDIYQSVTSNISARPSARA